MPVGGENLFGYGAAPRWLVWRLVLHPAMLSARNMLPVNESAVGVARDRFGRDRVLVNLSFPETVYRLSVLMFACAAGSTNTTIKYGLRRMAIVTCCTRRLPQY